MFLTLRTVFRITCLLSRQTRYNDNMDTLDDGFGHWLAGFIDGEGCFGIAQRQGEKHNSSIYYFCFMSIKLRDDDRSIIEEIRCRTGIGSIYVNKARSNSKTGIQWLIINKSDCLSLVEILDKYPLRAKKSKDYAIWREAVLLWVSQPLGHRWKGRLLDLKRWEQYFMALRESHGYHPPDVK